MEADTDPHKQRASKLDNQEDSEKPGENGDEQDIAPKPKTTSHGRFDPADHWGKP